MKKIPFWVIGFNPFGSTRSALIDISVRAGAGVCSCSTISTGTSLGFACNVSQSTYSAIGTPDCLQILDRDAYIKKGI